MSLSESSTLSSRLAALAQRVTLCLGPSHWLVLQAYQALHSWSVRAVSHLQQSKGPCRPPPPPPGGWPHHQPPQELIQHRMPWDRGQGWHSEASLTLQGAKAALLAERVRRAIAGTKRRACWRRASV